VSERRDRKTFELGEALSILERTPAILDVWLRGLPPGWLAANEGGDTWSPAEVLGHLIHGERADWIPRLRRILEHGDAVPFDPFDRLAQRRAPERTVPELLAVFSSLRAANLREVRDLGLGAADLDRRGRHPALGLVTLRNLLACWVAHDYDHLMQIARVVGSQYSDEVGPWRAYLRVVSGQPG
jgi:hypothetical protein